MIEKDVTLTFLEPFRINEWREKQTRNDARFMRGYAYARWHKSNDAGRPYITGTLVRSAFLKAVEQLLWANDGAYHGKECCSGEFQGSGARIYHHDHLPAKRRRRRQTLRWNDAQCKVNGGDPCLYCLLLGRFDTAEAGDKADHKFHVKFTNFNAPFEGEVSIDSLSDARVLNRVDQDSGKAEDFFSVREIDHHRCGVFNGKILLSDELNETDIQNLLSLLSDAAALVDKVAGALCRVEFMEAPPAAGTAKAPAKKEGDADQTREWAGAAADAFGKAGKVVHLRLFADTVRELRRHEPEAVIDLEKQALKTADGHRDRLGKPTPHFIWDNIRVDDVPLRRWLPAIHGQSGMNWQEFCRTLGQALYEMSKNLTPEQFTAGRPLGSAEGVHISDETATRLSKTADNDLWEILIQGEMTAQTPFFFGWSQKEETDDQISMRLLAAADGRLRLPRSVIRGILRRDLKIAFGTGCRAELGHQSPCACPVCNLMRQVTVREGRSKDYRRPPQVRHRIRIHPAGGTVAQGALFDMEVGPGGVAFPFELRLRSRHDAIPEKLNIVLSWWADAKGFFSGGAGTGKGRFALKIDGWSAWSIGDPTDFEHYKHAMGGRRETLQPKNAFQPAPVDNFPWTRMDCEFPVKSPFITKDPIQSMIDPRGNDAVCYRSVRVENGNEREIALLKGESFRGMLRTAVGRRHDLLTRDHDDCDCLLCRLFGNEHEAGRVRIEDLELSETPPEKHIDRVAIDRFTGGAMDRHKFDMLPIPATPEKPLIFNGKIWASKDLSPNETKALDDALKDIRSGLYPFGGLGNVGLGWVDYDPKAAPAGAAPETMKFASVPLDLKLDPDKIYWPHYFLALPKETVKRDPKPTSHSKIDETLHTGKIVCTIKTLTPLIIPDGENVQMNENKHKTYDFFNLNGERCIPGSEIKGMISSVFEALTNSCLRVFDEKKRLSWRMAADPKLLTQFRPGKVSEDGTKIVEMKEYRYPFYDENRPDTESQNEYFKNDGILKLKKNALDVMKKEGVSDYVVKRLQSIKNEEFTSENAFSEALANSIFPKKADKLILNEARKRKSNVDQIVKHVEGKNIPEDIFDALTSLRGNQYKKPDKLLSELKKKVGGNAMALAFKHSEGRAPRYDHPTPTDRMLLSLAEPNRTHAATNHFAIVKPDARLKADFMFAATSAENAANHHEDNVVKKSIPGFIKISGPNKVEKEKGKTFKELGPAPQDSDSALLIHNKVKLQKVFVANAKKRKDRDRLVPMFACYDAENDVTYKMTKRCERLFVPLKNIAIPIDESAKQKFEVLMDAYRENAKQQKTPPPFQTILPENGDIKNELLYFREENGKAVELIPVRISRTVDDRLLGEKLRDDFRPCVREILDEDQAAAIKDQGVKSLYQHHPEGLCPSCALFGTSFYKGRAAFGFAFPKDDEAPKLENDGQPITLPLLERPRPTWSMPRHKINQAGQGGNPRQPGNKGQNAVRAASREGQSQDNGQDKGDLIPGRKFYIHHQGWKRVIQKSKDGKEPQTENNRSVQAAASDQEFSFEIRLENLRDWELGLLTYALNLESGMAHKLGMGKPLGFGSVEIAVNEVVSEKPVDMAQLNAEAVKQLNNLWAVETADELVEKLGDLFKLLFYQKDERVRAHYPALNKDPEDTEKKPGYVELGDEKGEFKPEGRQEKLQTIWRPWHSNRPQDK